MPQDLLGLRPRRFGHNLLIRGGLRAYTLTLPVLGFECTWYEIKSRDINEKGKEFIFYNKPYMPSAGLHGPLHMVCALSPVPALTLALDLHAHTHSCTACCCFGKGVEGCMFSNVFFLFPLND